MGKYTAAFWWRPLSPQEHRLWLFAISLLHCKVLLSVIAVQCDWKERVIFCSSSCLMLMVILLLTSFSDIHRLVTRNSAVEHLIISDLPDVCQTIEVTTENEEQSVSSSHAYPLQISPVSSYGGYATPTQSRSLPSPPTVTKPRLPNPDLSRLLLRWLSHAYPIQISPVSSYGD